MGDTQTEPQIVIAAGDALFIQRTLVSLIDGGALRPLDREIVRQALAALERGEVLKSQEPKCSTPALDQINRDGAKGV
jgi:hypothetical protein